MHNPTIAPKPSLDRAARRADVVERIRAGEPLSAIAADYGVATSTIWRDYQYALEQCNEKIAIDAEAIRAQEIEKLNYLESCLADGCAAGNTKAISTTLRITERRAKLLGLDKQTPTTIIATPCALDDATTQTLHDRLAQIATIIQTNDTTTGTDTGEDTSS